MRKLNIFFTTLLIVVFCNLSFGQQNRMVYTFGTTLQAGSGTNVCYPKTPEYILPPNTTDDNNVTLETNISFVLSSTSTYNINQAIQNAYSRGFRKFFFQEGLYIVSTPIDLNNLNGITIEGAGSRTTFKPSATTLEAIFKISNNYNSKIMNLAIDLKTTLI